MNIQVNGTELFVWRHGHGPPILTLHAPGFDHTILRPWLDPLGETRELIYYDHRGSGRSRRGDLSGVTDRTWVEDADTVREALGFDHLVVFGHSYGGCLAQEYALAYPARVRGLILCATTPAFDYPDAIMANARSRARPEEFDTIVETFSTPLKDDSAFQDAWTRILPVYFHCYDARLGETLTRQIHFSADSCNRVFFHCLPVFNTVARLCDIGAPTLVLAGASDWITPPEHGANRLAARIPRSSLSIFANSGHFPYVEEQDRFLATVRAWLKELD